MVKRIVLAAVVIAAAMGVVKNGRVLKVMGLTGSCTVVQTAASGFQLEACRTGKLDGAPDLSRNGCTDTGIYVGKTYWRCPAPLAG